LATDELERSRCCSDVDWLKTGASERDGSDSAVIRRNSVADGTQTRRADNLKAIGA